MQKCPVCMQEFSGEYDVCPHCGCVINVKNTDGADPQQSPIGQKKPQKKTGRAVLAAVLVVCIAAGTAVFCIRANRKKVEAAGSTTPVSVSAEETAASFASKEDLIQKLSEAADYDILSFFCKDFDANGSPEGFAICGELSSERCNTSSYDVSSVSMFLDQYQLWYVDSRQTLLLDEKQEEGLPLEIICAKAIPITYEADDCAFMIADTSMHIMYTLYALDKNGDPTERVTGFDFEPALVPEPFGNWIQLREAYGTFGCRFSYFTFDLKERRFVRLGGSEITESDLKRVDGTEKAFDILADENAIIDSILYRSNGIVNINYYCGDLVSDDFDVRDPDSSGMFARAAITLLIRDGKAQLYETQDEEGIGMNFYPKDSPFSEVSDEDHDDRTVTPDRFPY